ncbi:MAG: HNH endonuclease [Candidatus Limnocylindrales bacterium]
MSGQVWRQCMRCVRILPVDEFGTHRRQADGLNPWCKSCTREQAAKWRAVNPDRERAKMLRYRNAHREEYNARQLARNETRRARKLAQACAVHPECAQIDLAAIRASGRCVNCGKKSKRLTVDHTIPLAKGGIHCRYNLQPMCKPCNSRKGASLPEQVPLMMLIEHREVIASAYGWEK